MAIKLGVVMDDIRTIKYTKDSTFAMLLEAERRNYEIFYFEEKDLFLKNGMPFGHAQRLSVKDETNHWFNFLETKTVSLQELDIILMRKDPPINDEYIYTTFILERAEELSVLVVNRMQSLRDANEKFFATYFKECSPPNIVTQSISDLRQFWLEHGDIICKPLNTMGGRSIFRLQANDVNAQVVFETLTQNRTFTMAQKFIPEIAKGDKRILLIDGEPINHALVRVPQGNDWRGNLAVGAKGVVMPLSDKDQWICAQIGPTLRERGLYFVGIDVIGDYLTEINLTSPTGIREIDTQLKINVSSQLFDCLEAKKSQ